MLKIKNIISGGNFSTLAKRCLLSRITTLFSSDERPSKMTFI